MDIPTRIAEQLADAARAERKAARAEKKKAQGGKTRIGNLARVARGASGLGGIMGKLRK